MLELLNVGLTYRVRHGFLGVRRYHALIDIDFELFEGETVGVIGGNGAGKSSLLRLIAGVTKPDYGEINLPRHLVVSLLSLQLGFTPELSGRDNAIFGAMLLGYSRAEAYRSLPAIVDFSELGAWIDEPIAAYSTGMKARLGFAIANEMNPDILLIDEIMGVGDKDFRKKSGQALLEKLESGQTTIFVSHNLDQVVGICQRVIWLERGRVKKTGPAREVIEAYKGTN